MVPNVHRNYKAYQGQAGWSYNKSTFNTLCILIEVLSRAYVKLGGGGGSRLALLLVVFRVRARQAGQ